MCGRYVRGVDNASTRYRGNPTRASTRNRDRIPQWRLDAGCELIPAPQTAAAAGLAAGDHMIRIYGQLLGYDAAGGHNKTTTDLQGNYDFQVTLGKYTVFINWLHKPECIKNILACSDDALSKSDNTTINIVADIDGVGEGISFTASADCPF